MNERPYTRRSETAPDRSAPASIASLRNAVDRLEAATLYLSTHTPAPVPPADKAALAAEVAQCIALLDTLLADGERA